MKYKYPIIGGVVLFSLISSISNSEGDEDDNQCSCSNGYSTDQSNCEANYGTWNCN